MYEDAHCCSNYTPKSYMLPLCEQDGRRSPDANITNICATTTTTIATTSCAIKNNKVVYHCIKCYNMQSLVFVFVVLSVTNTGARTTTHPVLRELQAAEFTRTCFSSGQLGRRCLELWLINAKICIT